MTKTKTGIDATRAARRRGIRWWLGLSGAAALVFFLGHPLLAADLSGTWDITCRVGPDRQIITLELVHEGSTVSGVGTVRWESTQNPVQVEVHSGTADGVDFRFFLLDASGPTSPPQVFFGNWYRDEMSGLTEGDFGSRIYRGNRRSSTY